jgi:uncharacterized protein YecE (DUF72 family)
MFRIDFHLIFTYSPCMILVGTCGFQHRDWVPVFYPRSLHPGRWLEHYSRRFGCCELGFTWYRIPEPSIIQQLIDGSSGMPFILRLPARVLGNAPDAAETLQSFRSAVWPLVEGGQLAGVLACFGAEFAFIRDNFRLLCNLRDSLPRLCLIAEFACRDWLTQRAARHLATERIALACIDGGDTERTFFRSTADLAYVRFQGRNTSKWLTGDGSARHDYLYSRDELAGILPEIRRLHDESERVFVLMNNPWRGQAAVNAQMFLELLSHG